MESSLRSKVERPTKRQRIVDKLGEHEKLVKFCRLGSSLVHDDIFESRIENGTRGLFAVKDLEEDALLFRHKLFRIDSSLKLKRSSVFSFDILRQLKANDNDEFMKKLGDEIEQKSTFETYEFFGTVVALMVENVQAESSIFGPYLEWLPSSGHSNKDPFSKFDSVLCWSDSEKALLNHTSISKELYSFEKASRQAFQTKIKQLSCLTDYLKAQNKNLEKMWDYFKVCAACVQAYSFTINTTSRPLQTLENNDDEMEKEEIAENDSESEIEAAAGENMKNIMVPLMDAFNASNRLNNVRLVLSADNSHLECRTTKAVKSGDQFYNTFGEMAVHERVVKYGYIEEDDEYCLIFSVRDIQTFLQGLESKQFDLKPKGLETLIEKWIESGECMEYGFDSEELNQMESLMYLDEALLEEITSTDTKAACFDILKDVPLFALIDAVLSLSDSGHLDGNKTENLDGSENKSLQCNTIKLFSMLIKDRLSRIESKVWLKSPSTSQSHNRELLALDITGKEIKFLKLWGSLSDNLHKIER